MKKGADISKCENYRYSLWRIWDESKPTITFIGLNPSTADYIEDDPTIRKCIKIATHLGAGGFYMANIFAYRSTDPSKLWKCNNPIGDENDEYLIKLANFSEKIIACWGNNGRYLNRSDFIKSMFNNRLYCLTINKTGEPKHPLYISSAKNIEPYNFES